MVDKRVNSREVIVRTKVRLGCPRLAPRVPKEYTKEYRNPGQRKAKEYRNPGQRTRRATTLKTQFRVLSAIKRAEATREGRRWPSNSLS